MALRLEFKRRLWLLRSIMKSKFIWVTRKIVLEKNIPDIQDISLDLPIHFRFGNENDVSSLTFDRHNVDNIDKEYALERLLKDDKLIIGEVDSEIVFYAWLMFGYMKLDSNSYFPIQTNTVYIYNVFTTKAFRGNKLVSGFYAYLKDILPEYGGEKLVCYIVAGNKPSFKAHERSGFQIVGCIYSIKCFTKTVHIGKYLENMKNNLISE